MTALSIERKYPYGVGAVLASLYVCFGSIPDRALINAVLPLVTSVAGIAIGFLATAQAILLSMSSGRADRLLRDAGYYCYLVGYLSAAIHWSFGAVAVSLLGLVLFDSLPPGIQRVGALSWWYVVGTSGALVYRVVLIFSKMLAYEHARKKKKK